MQFPPSNETVEAYTEAYDAYLEARDLWLERYRGLYANLDREVLSVVELGGDEGVTLAQVRDAIEGRYRDAGLDLPADTFESCRRLAGSGLVDYRKERRLNRAGRMQAQSVQYATSKGQEWLAAQRGKVKT